jgi:hypothetical protein
MANMQ